MARLSRSPGTRRAWGEVCSTSNCPGAWRCFGTAGSGFPAEVRGVDPVGLDAATDVRVVAAHNVDPQVSQHTVDTRGRGHGGFEDLSGPSRCRLAFEVGRVHSACAHPIVQIATRPTLGIDSQHHQCFGKRPGRRCRISQDFARVSAHRHDSPAFAHLSRTRTKWRLVWSNDLCVRRLREQGADAVVGEVEGPVSRMTKGPVTFATGPLCRVCYKYNPVESSEPSKRSAATAWRSRSRMRT